MRIEKYKSKTVEALINDFQEKQIKLHAYQLDLKSGKEKDTSKVKGFKHDIARILTLINVKNLSGEIIEAVKVVKEVKEVEQVKEVKEVKEVKKIKEVKAVKEVNKVKAVKEEKEVKKESK
jgi:ribosomal protein L29